VPKSVEFHAKKLMEAKEYSEAEPHINALSEMKTPKAVKALIEALKHKDNNVVSSSAWALSEIKDPRVVPALIGVLEHNNISVVCDGAGALGEIGKEAVPALIKALGHENDEVAKHSAWALGIIRDKSALPYLMKHADHSHMGVRSAVREAIRRIQGAKRV
jgi:HEAT repeat protein